MTSARVSAIGISQSVAAAVMLLWPGTPVRPAAAQIATTSAKAGSGASTQLEEIVVSNGDGAARKGAPPSAYAGGQVARGGNIGLLGDKDFMNTPFSTSSYTEKTIRDQQAQTVGQVLINSEPAVRASIDGNTNRTDTLTVRGFRVDNHDFALDGLYGLIPDYRTNAAPVERIEILRGAAAFLYGISPFGVPSSVSTTPRAFRTGRHSISECVTRRRWPANRSSSARPSPTCSTISTLSAIRALSLQRAATNPARVDVDRFLMPARRETTFSKAIRSVVRPSLEVLPASALSRTEIDVERMDGDDEILELLERWDRQQEGYIKQREERFGVMFDVLASALGDTFTVVDAACGPGSLSRRLLDRFPAARVIAIDADVMLLEMARLLLAADDHRVRLIEADLSHPSWPALALDAASALGGGRPAALVSTTALHWLLAGDLAEFYGAAGELLAPGGIVLNGDHMRFDARWPSLEKAAAAVRGRIERAAVAAGEDDWDAWWTRAANLPRLASLKARRDAFYAARQSKRPTSAVDCSVDFHVAALRHAGFVEVGTVWQQLDNYVVFGRRPS